MPIRDIFKVSRKTFLNPSAWFDLESIKIQNRTIIESLKSIFVFNKPLREETYEESLVRLNISDEEAQQTGKNYKWIASLFFILGLLVSIYTLYVLFHHGSITGFLLGFGASALLFSQAFQYNFWAFQIQQRKLGLSYKEWKNHFWSKGGPHG